LYLKLSGMSPEVGISFWCKIIRLLKNIPLPWKKNTFQTLFIWSQRKALKFFYYKY